MESTNSLVVRRALISVHDKTGIVQFARLLASRQVEILSTGGTASALRSSGVDVVDVSQYTGFPEILDGRVKTLHPKVHGGILARRDAHSKEMESHGIDAIDLVVANLYPFQTAIADDPADFDNALENIDVGGPSMVRAAAKNHHWACVVVDPADYAMVIEEINLAGGLSGGTRLSLAAKAFAHLAGYDSAIADYMNQIMQPEGFPPDLNLSLVKNMTMRYGENPHQSAAFYTFRHERARSRLNPRQIQGRALSFNNMSDVNAAIECVREFDDTTCAIIKHATPCGVASAVDLVDAYQRAYETDSISAFGGIVAVNRKLDGKTAKRIIGNQFVEVIAAPKFTKSALRVMASKQHMPVVRFKRRTTDMINDWVYTSVAGGMLIQDRDALSLASEMPDLVTERSPDESEMEDLLFAWKVCKHVKSNAIVYAADKRTTGIGAGQMSRLDSAHIAKRKAKEAGLDKAGQVMASDAFMPFKDALEVAVSFGIKAVIQPGGSIRDKEVIEFANQNGVAMVFTGMRHFRH